MVISTGSDSSGDTYDFATEAWTGAAEDAIVDTGLTLAEPYTFYTEGAGGEYIHLGRTTLASANTRWTSCTPSTPPKMKSASTAWA